MRLPLTMVAALGALCASAADFQPVHAWDFDVCDGEGRAADRGTSSRHYRLYGTIAAGQGFGATAGLVVSPGGKTSASGLPVDAANVTVDMKFRLGSALDGKTSRTLWYYAWNSWARGRWMASVTGDGRLAVSARQKSADKGAPGKMDMLAVSEVLGIVEGRYYTLRVQVADGVVSAWLDGKLVLKKGGFPAWNAFRPETFAKWYPLLRIGVDDDDSSGPGRAFLDGVADDVAIYDRALGAPDPFAATVDWSGLKPPEFHAVESTDDLLILNEKGGAKTGKFRVLDHEEGALGLMKRADARFTDNASTATVLFKPTTISVTIDCPVPDGMRAEKNARNAWAGDGVELFIRPSWDETAYCQYSANAAGVFSAVRCTAPNVKDGKWRSRAKAASVDTDRGFRVTFEIPSAEVFAKPLAPGDSFGINFVRCGATCSGLSTWAAVGGRFNNIDAYGKAVYGGAVRYFGRKLAKAREKASAFGPEGGRDAAKAALDAVAKAVSAHAAEEGAFAALETMFANLDRTFLSIRLAGKPLLVYRPSDPWGDRLESDALTAPLETIRLKVPVNGRVDSVFAVSNLKDADFVGQLKFFDSAVPVTFNDGGRKKNGAASHFKIARGFAIANRAGRKLFDPIEPLAMGSVLRLSPMETAPVYLEFDACGIEPGRHFCVLALKHATPGFGDERIGVEIEVVDADVSSVAADKAGYDYIGRSFKKKRTPCPRLVRRLADRRYNVVFVQDCVWSPRSDKDGRFRMGSFDDLDAQLDGYIVAGFPKDRMKLWVYLTMEASRDWFSPRDWRGERHPFGSGKHAEGIRFMVEGFARHVGERYGIGKDRIYWYPVDEPSGAVDDPSYKSGISRAIYLAREIKRADSANMTMTDPLPSFLGSSAIGEAMRRFAEVYDVIELYRPAITEETRRLVKRMNFKEVWTYSIITKETSAVTYRRDTWENLRDGFREIATFWHMTSCAGEPFDSSDAHSPGHYDDWASLYADFDNDDSLLSRRQLAADMAFEDARIVLYARRKFAGNAEMLARIEATVKEAADVGTMAAMDMARERLLGLLSGK